MNNEIISYLVNHTDGQPVSAGDVLKHLKIERTKLFRSMRQLVSDGVVDVSGSGRNTRYRINKSSEAYLRMYLSTNPADRPVVAYNEQLLLQYEPNKTFMLSKEQRKSMADASMAVFENVSGDNYRKILGALVIDLTHASSNLEGVDISWLDTKMLIETNQSPLGMSGKDRQVVLNHKEAISFMVNNRLDINKRDILDIHSILIKDLLDEPGGEGKLRVRPVNFDGSQYIPIDNPFVLGEEFDVFIEKCSMIKDPFEQAFFATTLISYLQPFQDGNKRTSRLVSNIPLIKSNVAPLSYADFDRKDYILGLLAFYECGRHEILASSFTNAYIKTSSRYNRMMGVVNSGGTINTIDTLSAWRERRSTAKDEDDVKNGSGSYRSRRKP